MGSRRAAPTRRDLGGSADSGGLRETTQQTEVLIPRAPKPDAHTVLSCKDHTNKVATHQISYYFIMYFPRYGII